MATARSLSRSLGLVYGNVVMLGVPLTLWRRETIAGSPAALIARDILFPSRG